MALSKGLMPACQGSQVCCCQSPDPTAGYCQPCLLWKFLDTHGQVWLSLLWSHCSFLLGLGVHKVLLCPPKVCFSGGFQSFCRIPRLGNLERLWARLWALELLLHCENFFGIIVLQFVGCLQGSSIVALMVNSSKRTYAFANFWVVSPTTILPFLLFPAFIIYITNSL